MALINIEGPDGSGKDAVADACAKRIGDIERLNFPNDNSPSGKLIRDYLKGEWAAYSRPSLSARPAISALAFQSLQLTNRMEVFDRLMRAQSAGSMGEHLIIARYWQSGWVYGQLDGLDGDYLERLHSGLPSPTVNILLRTTAETCMARRAKRDGAVAPERYEGKMAKTLDIVRLYNELWQRYQSLATWRVVDAEQPLDDVVEDVLEHIEATCGI